MKRLCSIAAALVMALSLFATAEAKTYINGIDANYPPFAYVGEDGKPAGFDVESMTWIANKMGFEVKHQPMDWDGIIPALLANKIDMVCSGMSISPERVAQVDFSTPYYVVSKVFMTRSDSALTVDEILGSRMNIGVQRGTNEHSILESMMENDKRAFKLRFYDSAPMAVEDLLNGRLDVIALDSFPAKDAIDKGKAVKMVGSFAPDDDFGVAIRKGDTELMNLVNEGYKHLMADPFWKELEAKYLQ